MNTIAHKLILLKIPAAMLIALLGAALAAAQSNTEERQPVLATDTDVATAGYFQLQWQSDEPVRLLESTSADFADPVVVYVGNDHGHMISGRADGELYFRLVSAATGETLGETVHVVVAHHPLGRALTFFTVGAIVFVATLAMILIAGRETER